MSFTKILPGKVIKEIDCVVPVTETEKLSSGLLVCLYAYNFMKNLIFAEAQKQQIRTIVLNVIRRRCGLVLGIERSSSCLECKEPLQRQKKNGDEKIVSCYVCGARRHMTCISCNSEGYPVYRCGDDIL